jgi:CubicO group peptidase (beta-lactamase class C family)
VLACSDTRSVSARARDYASLIEQRIARPLALADTRDSAAATADMLARLAPGHDARGRARSLWMNPTLAGAGAILSTLDDMMTYLAANLAASRSADSPRLGAALAETHAPRRPTGLAPTLDVGLFWHVLGARDDRVIVWHNGMTGGCCAFIGFEPARQVGVVVLANAAASVDAWAVAILSD